MPRPVWKEGVSHAEPKSRCQIQEALPIIRRHLIVVEVMPGHHTSRGLLTTAKLNIEVTQHHHRHMLANNCLETS